MMPTNDQDLYGSAMAAISGFGNSANFTMQDWGVNTLINRALGDGSVNVTDNNASNNQGNIYIDPMGNYSGSGDTTNPQGVTKAAAGGDNPAPDGIGSVVQSLLAPVGLVVLGIIFVIVALLITDTGQAAAKTAAKAAVA